MLKPYVGTWNAEVKMWADPDKDPQMSRGTMTNRLILGGRFLEQKFVGKGDKFEGQGLLGYDNLAKVYVSSWVDSMTTGEFMQTGTYDPAAKEITLKGRVLDPVTEKEIGSRTTLSSVQDDKYVFTMYSTEENGKEGKILEITYTKAHPSAKKV
jgi:hypothetical protein